MRRILYLAAGLLLAVETSNAAPAQNSVPDALAHTPDVNRAFPAPPPTRKAWTERLFEGVTEELAAAGERAAGIAKGTREGIRGLLQAGYDALPRRLVPVDPQGQAQVAKPSWRGPPSDDELDEMLQRLDALQTPPIKDLGDRPPPGQPSDSERPAPEKPTVSAENAEGARGLLRRLQARGEVQQRPTTRTSAYSQMLPSQLVQAGFQDWENDEASADESTGIEVASAFPDPLGSGATCLDVQQQGAEPLRLAASAGDASDFLDKLTLAEVMPDQPRLLPDGSLFLPKLAQRLLEIGTLQACEEQLLRVESVSGRVVADPDASGLVQAAQVGRIRPGPDGLPALGTRVRAGQPLAVLEPAVPAVERGQLERQLAELRSQIIETELQLARMRDFPIVPFRSGRMLALRLELDGLRKQRDQLIAALDDHEVLLSPVEGVISRAEIRAGQLAQPGDTLWEIVDPQRLRLEVLAPADFPLEELRGAQALTSGGERLELRLAGQGKARDDGSLLLQFKIEDPPKSLRLETMVQVHLSGGEPRPALLLPQEALWERGDGSFLVWEHLEGERFLPRRVRGERGSDSAFILRDGLEQGARIVHRGVEQLERLVLDLHVSGYASVASVARPEPLTGGR